MANAEEKYLREVLGLQSIMVPAGLEDEFPGHFDVYGEFNLPIAVISFKPLNQNERELAQKMLKAIGQDQLLSIEFKSDARKEDWDEFESAYQGKALWLCGERPQYLLEVKLPSIELPSLSELLDQSNPDELMKLKRSVWAKLKTFHAEVTA
jgi:hypothetical protein